MGAGKPKRACKKGKPMEQMMIFLTDNSTWILTGMNTFTFILVVVTLHKINRMSGCIRKMEQCRMVELQSVEQERKDSAVKEENIQMEQEKQAKALETKKASERLLHDVIEEVFS